MEQEPAYSNVNFGLTYNTAPNLDLFRNARSNMYNCPTRGFRVNANTTAGGQAIDYVAVGVYSSTVPDLSAHASLGKWHATNSHMGGAIIPAAGRFNGETRSRVTIGGVTDGMGTWQ